MATPEKLNLWDRLFNRYRKEVINRGQEKWFRIFNTPLSEAGIQDPQRISYIRTFVDYKVVDRLTGSETIKRDFLT